ncbi:hypothetical protein ACVIGB_009665 [Bradyrhizobium sp. USDA 4341]
MDDQPIFDVLANWPGRVSTQLAFEARGFLMPAAWQNRMIEFCGASQADLLNRYWDEVAMETMRAVGKVNSDNRRFFIEPRYRSAFLDELFARKDFSHPDVPNGPPVRCLLEHFRKYWHDLEFRENELIAIRNRRKCESERLEIQTTGWTGKKRGSFLLSTIFAPRSHSSVAGTVGKRSWVAVSSSRLDWISGAIPIV